MANDLIILAGATGRLGRLIAASLIERGARVRALTRRGGSHDTSDLRRKGVSIAEVDYFSKAEMVAACGGGACIVSALSGLEDVLLDSQSQLLDAAIAAD